MHQALSVKNPETAFFSFPFFPEPPASLRKERGRGSQEQKALLIYVSASHPCAATKPTLPSFFFFFFLSGPDGDQYGAMRTRKWGPDDFCYANTHDTQWINHLKTCLFPIPLAGSVAVVFWSCSLVVL